MRHILYDGHSRGNFINVLMAKPQNLEEEGC